MYVPTTLELLSYTTSERYGCVLRLIIKGGKSSELDRQQCDLRSLQIICLESLVGTAAMF